MSNLQPIWSPPPGRPGSPGFDLRRRGVDHGRIAWTTQAPGPDPDTALGRWRDADAVHLPGLVAAVISSQRAAIAASSAMFDRLRDGAGFLDELDARLGDHDHFRYAGSTIDRGDQREIERVFIDVPGDEEHRRVRDLTVRLSWIADDEQDLSLRIRFSFGHDATRDWLHPDRPALWSDHLAATTFPENAALRQTSALRAVLDRLVARPWRLSELIVYSNAPGGGAVFHHDADPGQRGVVYAQLAGTTVWLACPRRRLAERAAAIAGAAADDVFARMLDDGDEELWRLLNATPALTGDLARTGHLFVLEPGDVLLLPSHDEQRCCWHSVFGVGQRPSLAHSLAIFDALPDAMRDPRLVEDRDDCS